jgi:K+ potassium transporter
VTLALRRALSPPEFHKGHDADRQDHESPKQYREERHNKVLHERIVLLTVITERAPRVPDTERVNIEELGKGIARATVRFGFAERPALPPAVAASLGFDLSKVSTPVPTVHLLWHCGAKSYSPL